MTRYRSEIIITILFGAAAAFDLVFKEFLAGGVLAVVTVALFTYIFVGHRRSKQSSIDGRSHTIETEQSTKGRLIGLLMLIVFALVSVFFSFNSIG